MINIFIPDECWNTLYLNTDVKQVIVTAEQSAVEPNTILQFSAVVEGILNKDQSVTWSVEGNTSKATEISESGLLAVVLDEKAESLVITAISVQDKTKYESCTIAVMKREDFVEFAIANGADKLTETECKGLEQTLCPY